eukprot:Sspe_Gene.68730::Locus_40521_Transcript_1_2_Confidence_0.800_Length_2294::g.68730::m.68730
MAMLWRLAGVSLVLIIHVLFIVETPVRLHEQETLTAAPTTPSFLGTEHTDAPRTRLDGVRDEWLITKNMTTCPPSGEFSRKAPYGRYRYTCPSRTFSAFDPQTGTLRILDEWREKCKNAFWHPCRPLFPGNDTYSGKQQPGETYQGPWSFPYQSFVNGVATGINNKSLGHECVVVVCAAACHRKSKQCAKAIEHPMELWGAQQWNMSSHPRGAINLHMQFLPERSVPPRPDKLNVVVLLIDSLSRGHYLRTMWGLTKHFQHLQAEGKMQVIDFCGMRAHGWSTLETQPIMWAGNWDNGTSLRPCNTDKAGRASLHPDYNITRDNIFAYYRDNGYITGSFSNPMEPALGCLGVVENCPVVDFLQTRILIESYFSNQVADVKSTRVACLGDVSTPQQALRSVKEMFRAKPKEPKFMLVVDNIAHQNNQDLSYVWESTGIDTLKFLEDTGELEKTIVVFASDHGQPGGPWARTRAGHEEITMPTFIAAFPTQFLRDHPATHRALLLNQRRTVSQYDFHETLRHLASFPNPPPLRRVGRSLLVPLPEDRPCDEFNANHDGRIQRLFCKGNNTVVGHEDLSIGENGWEEMKAAWSPALSSVIDQANGALRNASLLDELCHPLTLANITSVRRTYIAKDTNKKNRLGYQLKRTVKTTEVVMVFNTTVPALWTLTLPEGQPKLPGLKRESLYEPDRQACPTVPGRLVPLCLCRRRDGVRNPLDGIS